MSLRFTPEQLAETMRHLERQRYKQPDFIYINGEPVKMPAKEVRLLAADGQTPLSELTDARASGREQSAEVQKPNDAAIPASAKIAGNGDAREPDVHTTRTGATRGNHSMAAEIRGRGTPYKSKLEARYAEQLEWRKKEDGRMVRWLFESFTLKLPGGLRFTPDFWVETCDWDTKHFEFHEVKGPWFREPARLRLRAAVETYPMFDWFIVGADLSPRRLRTAADVPKGGKWT